MSKLSDVLDLIWPQSAQLNDYVAANNEVIRLVEASNLKLRERQPVHLSTGYRQLYDPLFPSYNANRIPNTNFVAAEGPNDIGLNGLPVRGSIVRFLENTLFNHAFPIQLILAIGHVGRLDVRGDFAHYFAEGIYSYQEVDEASRYEVKSRLINRAMNQYELIVENQNGLQRSARLFWLPMADLQPIPTHRTAILTLAQVYHLSRMEPAILHCAAGIGRTGTALLTFEILEHYSSIFADDDPVHMANQIQALLINIRSIRPAFITTKIQLESAIQCAINIKKDRARS